MHCQRCRTITDTLNSSEVNLSNDKRMIKGDCAVCGRAKCQIVKSPDAMTNMIISGGDLVGMLNKVTKNFKLPLQTFPGEMHIPGMNYAGPGTRLDYRLNDDGTPKQFSKPVDRVDQAAYIHDLAYNEYSDIANRNIADREMVQQLDSIDNPTTREKIERAIIKPIINAKQKFGLGIRDRAGRFGRRPRELDNTSR